MTMVNFQIGKNGITPNFISNLEKTFKKSGLVKVSVLKSASHEREEIKNIANDLCSELKKLEGKEFTAKVLGFTIYIKKWRKLKQT